MHRPNRRLTLLAACCALGISTFGALSAHAADWPTAKPITWVVPFAPGGSTDVVARVVAADIPVVAAAATAAAAADIPAEVVVVTTVVDTVAATSTTTSTSMRTPMRTRTRMPTPTASAARAAI